MLKQLSKIATKLDELGLNNEADLLDLLIAKASSDPELDFEYDEGIDPDSDLHDPGDVGMSDEDKLKELAEAEESENAEPMNMPDYHYYIVRKEEEKGPDWWIICSGWSFLSDAKDAFKDAAMDKGKDKIVHKSRLKNYDLDAENNDDWLGGPSYWNELD